VIEYINKNIEKKKMSEFIKDVIKFRENNVDYCHKRIKKLLTKSFSTLYEYVMSINFEQKPDYDFIKLLLA
jgi:uncharacterized protein (DUF1015 family)